MSISIIWSWSWKSSFMESLHEGKFFEWCYSRHIEPVSRSSFKVISVVLDCAEWRASKSSKFDNYLLSIIDVISIFILPIAAITDVDITLFTNSNLLDHSLDMASFHENLQSQIIVAHISKGVPIVIFSCMEYAFVLKKKLGNFICVWSFKSCEWLYESHRNELVVLHSHLDRSENSEVFFGEILNEIRIKFHGSKLAC